MSAQMATQALRIVQQILLVPLFLKVWDIDIYTDWLVINAGVAFAGIFDGGMQPYFSGLLQERLVQGDIPGYRRAARIATTNYLAMIVIAGATAGVASLAGDWRGWLGIHALSPHDAFLTLLLLGTNILIVLPFGVAGSLYKAHGEYDRGVMVALSNLAIQIAVPALLLALSQPITVLAAGTILSSLLNWTLVSLDQRIRYGHLPWGVTIPSAAELRTTAIQCAFFNAQPITTWLTVQGPVLILGHLGNPVATVAFTTARTLIGVGRQLTVQLANPFGFELSILLLREELPALRRLLENAVSIIGIVGGLLAGMIVVAGLPAAALWLHGRVVLDQSLIVVLALPVAAGASAQIYQLLLVFSNRPRLIAYAVIAYAVLGLTLALALAPRFGASGVAAGLAIGEVVALVIYLPAGTLRMLHIDGAALRRNGLLRTALAMALSYGIARACAALVPPTDIPRLIAFGGLWTIASGLCAFFFLLAPAQRRLASRIFTAHA